MNFLVQQPLSSNIHCTQFNDVHYILVLFYFLNYNPTIDASDQFKNPTESTYLDVIYFLKKSWFTRKIRITGNAKN